MDGMREEEGLWHGFGDRMGMQAVRSSEVGKENWIDWWNGKDKMA